MLDIKQEIQILLLKNGLSMSKMVKNLRQNGLLKTNKASFSRMLTSKTVKFEVVQTALDYLGYEFVIRKKEK